MLGSSWRRSLFVLGHLILAIPLMATTCLESGQIDTWPDAGSKVPLDAQVVVSLYGSATKLADQIELHKPVFASRNGEVPAIAREIYRGDLALVQIVFAPAEPLGASRLYSLRLHTVDPGIVSSYLISKWQGQYLELGPWQTAESVDRSCPVWNRDPKLVAAEFQYYGGGSSAQVSVRVEGQDDSSQFGVLVESFKVPTAVSGDLTFGPAKLFFSPVELNYHWPSIDIEQPRMPNEFIKTGWLDASVDQIVRGHKYHPSGPYNLLTRQFVPVRGGMISFGHQPCAGAFLFDPSSTYTVCLSLRDVAGHSSDRSPRLRVQFGPRIDLRRNDHLQEPDE